MVTLLHVKRGMILRYSICILFALLCGCKQKLQEIVDYTQFVNPFIGTLHEGHCFPGATVPFAMVQPGPESHTAYYEGYEMDHITGYQYTDSLLKGFTQTHLNGVGCPSMSDILMMPYSRDIVGDENTPSSYYSDYDKDSEQASPGFYSVNLLRNGVKVSLTASPHVAYHQYCYSSQNANLLIDLQYGVNWNISALNTHILDSSEAFEDDYTLSGYRLVKDWTIRKVYYVIKFNKKIVQKKILKAVKGERARRYVLSFELGEDCILQAKVALSTTGIAGAKKNLEHEIPEWNSFAKIRSEAQAMWNKLLSKIDIKTDSEMMTVFYTSLYHLFLQPNNIADVDGRYRAENDSIYHSVGGRFYSTFSFWDTFRAVHPMYTILIPDSVGSFINSIFEGYLHKPTDIKNEAESNKYLPRWALWGRETNTMVGNHSIPVIVEAYMKGLLSDLYDMDDYYEAVLSSATKPHYRNHVELISKYGYIPYDVKINSYDDGRETVSRLLESIYDDYCAGVLAQQLGKDSIAEYMFNRSGYYRNVYNKQTGFMCGRDSKGVFKNENPAEVVGEWLPHSSYTEGNSWHYLFHVLHDIPGMIDLMGGKDSLANKLDSMFYAPNGPEVKTLVWKIIGTLGQYWHGNEPCHHVPYLYKFTDKSYKTDMIIHKLVNDFYKNAPDGLKGNDDCGQMSAWYLFSALGFYPVDPVSCQFVIGAPQIDRAILKLDGDRRLEIIIKKRSNDCFFVKEVYLNGKLLNRPYITYQEIMNGGKLVFTMYSRKN